MIPVGGSGVVVVVDGGVLSLSTLNLFLYTFSLGIADTNNIIISTGIELLI